MWEAVAACDGWLPETLSRAGGSANDRPGAPQSMCLQSACQPSVLVLTMRLQRLHAVNTTLLAGVA